MSYIVSVYRESDLDLVYVCICSIVVHFIILYPKVDLYLD